MGVATGYGLKEIYRFPHTTYPYTPLVSVLFCSSIPTFFVHFLNIYTFINIINVNIVKRGNYMILILYYINFER